MTRSMTCAPMVEFSARGMCDEVVLDTLNVGVGRLLEQLCPVIGQHRLHAASVVVTAFATQDFGRLHSRDGVGEAAA